MRGSACESLAEKIFQLLVSRKPRERVSFWENARAFGVPPSLTPLEALTGAGFAKMVCKILSAKGLEVKILTTKELSPLSRV